MALFNAILDPTSPRYSDWQRILGSDILDGDQVPLESPQVYEGRFGESPATVRIYKLAIARLSPDQRERLVDWIADKFSSDREELRKELDVRGFPIREADVIVSFNMRAFI